MTSIGTGTAAETLVKAKTCLEALAERQNSASGQPSLLQLPIEDRVLEGETAKQFWRRVKERFPDLVLSDEKLGQCRMMVALEILRQEGLSVQLVLGEAAQQGESTRTALDKKVKELARSNEELEQFANVASHDLQEPLRMVSTYTQLLSEQYSGKLDEKADKYIHYAVDGALRMQTLIHDLLEFSRTGRADPGLKSTDCGEEVRQVVISLQSAIDETGAVITVGPLPVVMARASQLRQVFQNIIGNAIKFHDGKPPQVQVSAEKKGNEWVFSIVDNGISIAPENAEKIFAIFQRLHTRTEYPGNGIGLAICRKIVEQHGGTIWLAPQTTQGATFKFTWPDGALENKGSS